MARSIFATRPRRSSLLTRYFSEPVNYGGKICTRAEVIDDLRSQGVHSGCIDRYLQGAELRNMLEAGQVMKPLTTTLQ